jgi:hypothetical protein
MSKMWPNPPKTTFPTFPRQFRIHNESPTSPIVSWCLLRRCAVFESFDDNFRVQYRAHFRDISGSATFPDSATFLDTWLCELLQGGVTFLGYDQPRHPPLHSKFDSLNTMYSTDGQPGVDSNHCVPDTAAGPRGASAGSLGTGRPSAHIG